MEYCAGGGLIDYLNTRLQNRLHEREVLAIFRDVCAAVQVMHHMDPPLVHRDLKIENVLLSGTQPPTFKLCDFGSCFPLLSRKPPQSTDELRRLEQELNTHTTLQYRSPEMVDLTQRRVIDTSADVWALGVLLYKLCYYTTPFEGPNGGPRAILQGRFDFPSHPRYSSTLQALIAGMLRVEQRERPSVDAVLERVHGMLGLPPPPPVHDAGTTSVRRSETVRRNGTVRRDVVQQRPASASPRPTHAVSPPPSQPVASGAALGRSATTAHAASGPSVLSRAATFQAGGAAVGRSAPPKPASLASRGPSSAHVSPEPRASPRLSPHPPAAPARTPSPPKDAASGPEPTADAGKEPFSPSLVDAQSRFPSVDQLDAAPSRDRVRSVAEQLNQADRPASDAPAPHTSVLVDIDSGDEDEGPEDVGPMIRLHPRGAPKDTVLDMPSADERPARPEPEPEPEPEPRRAPGSIRSQIAAIQDAVGATPASAQRQRAPARRLSDLVAQDTAQNDTDEAQNERELRAIEEQEKALAALLQSDAEQDAGPEEPAEPEPLPVESPAAEPVEGKLIDIESPKVMTPTTEAQKRAPSWDEEEAAPPRRPSAGKPPAASKPPVANKPTAHRPPVLNKPPVANKPALANKPAAQKASGNGRPAPAPASVPQRASTWDVTNKSKPRPPQKKYVDVSTSPGLHPTEAPEQPADAAAKATEERAAAPPEDPSAPAPGPPAPSSERPAEPAAPTEPPKPAPEEKRPSIYERMEQLKLAQQPTSEPPVEHRTGKPSPRWPPAGSPAGSPPRTIESQLNSALHQPNTRLTKRTTVAGAPRSKPQALRPWEQEAQQSEAYQKQRVIPQEDRASPPPEEEGTSFRGVSAMVNRWQSGGAQ